MQELRRTVFRTSNRANPEWTTEALAASTVSSTRQTGTQLGLYEWSEISPPGLGGDPPPTWTRRVHTLRSLDHSIHDANVVGSTSECVTADVAVKQRRLRPPWGPT